jgi:hypothetical protein
LPDISETEFRISVLLDVINDDGDESKPPTILLRVQYPEEYPDEPPVLDLFPEPNAAAHPFFSVASDKQVLLDGLSETVEENLGMAMIFTLVSTLKENAEQLIAARQESARQEQEQKLLAAEEEENKKFHGTAVNAETFQNWRLNFRKEMEELKLKEEEAEEAAEKKKNRGKDTVIPLTGKQLWERGLAGKIDEDDFDDGSVAAAAGEKTVEDGVEKLAIEV